MPPVKQNCKLELSQRVVDRIIRISEERHCAPHDIIDVIAATLPHVRPVPPPLSETRRLARRRERERQDAITIDLPDHVMDRLRAIARARGLSASGIIDAIAEALASSEQ